MRIVIVLSPSTQRRRPPPPRPPPPRPPPPPTAAAAQPAAADPPPTLCRPRFECCLTFLPRFTLPTALGSFGRLSARAPAFGLPDGRKPPSAWPPADRLPPTIACRRRLPAAGRDCPPPPIARRRTVARRRPIGARPLGPVDCRLAHVVGPRRAVGMMRHTLLPDGIGLVAKRVRAIRLDAVPDLRPVDVGYLVAVEVDLGAVDVLPVDVVPVDLAVEVTVVEAVVAVDSRCRRPSRRPRRPSRPSRRPRQKRRP